MTKYWAKRFRNIILTGMPATGKTTFGKLYAQHSERFFLDFDAFIESTTKKTIPQIFSQEGEEGFRNLEEKILLKLERRHNFVIAFGGGTLLKPESIAFARKLGLIVMLDLDLTEIAKRIFVQKETRPMFSHCQSLEEVQKMVNDLYIKRRDAYEQSDVVINATYNTFDCLKMHLAMIEKRAGNREYMQDVYNIMNKKNKYQSKWSEKEEEYSEEQLSP
ncbi:shikimate kinase [Pigmentibacter ruber]|uniref:shikimate kinase n=1 Tax=Pigmentibacter ruber TaxID=2683196 RepID=UPI00131B34D7|nr:shikimate kinase [Pigmentibacter ruber]